MPGTQDTQLALLISRLEILTQEVVDGALAFQAKAEEEGKPIPFAAVLVREGILPYGVVERLIAHQGDTPFSCKACNTQTGAKSLDPRHPFVCPSCQKALTPPEEDTALTALETLIQGPVESSKPSDLIGRTLGGCKLQRKIGEGGMGAVYEARQEYLNRTVAVKVLPEHHVHQSGFVQRFLRESRSAAQVIHPNVVQVMDAGREAELHYIIMEFVPGKSLYDILNEDGKIPVPKALEYTRQSAQGLAAAAELSIIHRDIKPDNIRINPRGIAKVADFGLAKDVETSDQVTMTGAVVGTPLYMSPEQARGEQVDFRSDIYSLGATLYHLIAGEPPFTGKSAMAILEKVTQQELPPIREVVEDCSPEVENLIRKMMCKKPEDRFHSYAAVIKAIEEVQGRATTLRETMVQPPAPDKKPRRLAPILLVLAILVGGAGGLWFWLGGGKEGGPEGSGSGVSLEQAGAGDSEGGEGLETNQEGEGGTGESGPTGPPAVPPAPTLAGAKITSDPEGATVRFEGEVIGTTPITRDNLSPGTGLLRLEKEGYEPMEEPVELVAGEALSRSYPLRQLPGSIRITSTPSAGATLFLDGERKGVTPFDLAELKPGSYELRLELEGYDTAIRKIEIQPGENPEESVALKALPASLKITTDPAGARIRMDGVYVGKSPLELNDLSSGSHEFEASLPYHMKARWEMDLAPGKETEREVALARPEEVVRFLSGVAEAETLLGEGFELRAWDRFNLLLKEVGFPRDLTAAERDGARRLVAKVGGKDSPLDLSIRFSEGGEILEGATVLPPEPTPGGDAAGGSKNYTVLVSQANRSLKVCVVQFAMNGEYAYRLLPSEARRAAEGAKIRSLQKDWSETYKRRGGDIYLFLLLATPSDLTLADIDEAKSQAIAVGGVDPVKRGHDVMAAMETWLKGRGEDFCLRAAWIDERSGGK